MLVVDAANVIGSRPTGWWRDRAGAARGFVARVVDAVETGALDPPVVVVLEGAARAGARAGPAGPGTAVAHASASGDDTVVDVVAGAARDGQAVEVVTADRGLRDRVRALGARVVGPDWLLTRLDAEDTAGSGPGPSG